MNNVKRKLVSIGIAILAVLTIGTISAYAAPPRGNLDQCGNGPLSAPVPCNNGNWINGNLNSNQAHYFEGETVPYRLRLTNIPAGTHNVTIEWDTLKSGKHALDYVTTFNRTETTADPCSGAGFTCSGLNTTFPIPLDSNVAAAGITQIPGVFTLFGGTITAVSGYTVSGTDNSTRITITFTNNANSPNLVLAWGGHISTRRDWGIGNSAISIPGSPYHTRFIDLDGSGGNQDRSLASAAVIFPGSITIIKDAIPDDSTATFNFTATPSPLTNFNLTDPTNPNKTFSNISNFATYTITEQLLSGWNFTGIGCTVIDPGVGGGSTSSSGSTLTVNLVEGNVVQCTFTNQRQQGTLIVIKHVINDNGGTNVSSDFTMNVTGTNVTPASFPGNESGTTISLDPGSYSVNETGPAGYTNSTIGDCTGSIAAGETKTCTVINNDQAATLIVKKHVINDNGGTNVSSDFTMNVTGTNVTPASFPGDESGTIVTLDANTPYSVSEIGPSGYTETQSADCSGTIPNGQTKTCIVTNNDNASTLIVIKHVINDNGGTNVSGDFTMNVTGTNVTPNDFAGQESPGTTVTLDAGSYSVNETGPFGYDASFSADCSGTIANGEIKICTVTNNDQFRHLSFTKIGALNITSKSTDYTINVTNDGDVNVTIVNITDPNSAVSCDTTFSSLLEPGQTIHCSVSYPTDTTITATTLIEIELAPSQPHIFWTV
jgi:hypothetical protein